jgi:F0F1-type ATP synthase assembly protein I
MRSNEHDPDAPDEGEEQVPRVEMPPSPTFPPPPEIQFTRPAQRPVAGRNPEGSRSRPPDQSISDGDPNSNAAQYGALLSAGTAFAASVIVGVFLGQWLDHKFNPSGVPWFTIVLTAAGLGAGFTTLFRLTAIHDRNKKK